MRTCLWTRARRTPRLCVTARTLTLGTGHDVARERRFLQRTATGYDVSDLRQDSESLSKNICVQFI